MPAPPATQANHRPAPSALVSWAIRVRVRSRLARPTQRIRSSCPARAYEFPSYQIRAQPSLSPELS